MIFPCLEVGEGFRKICAPIKIKSALPPPKKTQIPPPLKRGILWTLFFLQNERIFPGVHKIDAPISGPRIADKNFTDTKRIFLKALRELTGSSFVLRGRGGLSEDSARRMRGLAHRNRSDFCDLRLRCPSRTPEIARFLRQETAMMHCDLRVRWKVASDLRFRAAISEPKIPSFCGISGDLAPSTRKSLAIAIVRFWCAKMRGHAQGPGGGNTLLGAELSSKSYSLPWRTRSSFL